MCDVLCVRRQQDPHDVLDAMKRHRVKRMAVCHDDRRILGIVTRSDLVPVFFDRYTCGKRALTRM